MAYSTHFSFYSYSTLSLFFFSTEVRYLLLSVYRTVQRESQTRTIHLSVAFSNNHHDCNIDCRLPWIQWLHQGLQHVQSRQSIAWCIRFNCLHPVADSGGLVGIPVLQDFQGEINFDQSSLMIIVMMIACLFCC